MSRDMFDRDLELLIKKKPERYRGGKLAFDPDLLKSVADDFFSRSKANEILDYALKKDHRKRLRNDPELDGQAFLDAVVSRFQEADEMHQHLSDLLIDPVISILYQRGENDFILDYTHFLTEHLALGKSMKGTKENPLSIAVLLPHDQPMRSVGWDARYCTFRVGGTAIDASYLAKSCTFILKAPPEKIGITTQSSVFYIDGVESAQITNDRGWYKADFSNAQGITWEYELLDASNHFFIPDGKGDWKEVLPE